MHQRYVLRTWTTRGGSLFTFTHSFGQPQKGHNKLHKSLKAWVLSISFSLSLPSLSIFTYVYIAYILKGIDHKSSDFTWTEASRRSRNRIHYHEKSCFALCVFSNTIENTSCCLAFPSWCYVSDPYTVHSCGFLTLLKVWYPIVSVYLDLFCPW